MSTAGTSIPSVRQRAFDITARRAALNSVIKPSRTAVDMAPLTCNAAKSGRCVPIPSLPSLVNDLAEATWR